MKITVVTPSFNQAQFIERTILSVLSQNYDNIEYIIVDGLSTDGTSEVVKKYRDKLIWISEKDNGQSEAINKGLRMATGDIVTYLNSDDIYEPGALKNVVSYFQNKPEMKWAYGKCRIIDENDKEIRKPITAYKNLLLKNYSYSKLLTENFISQPATFWRRELFEEIGFLNENENFCMDYEYWLRIGSHYNAGIINVYLAQFRYYSESKSGKNTKLQFQDEFRLANKYGKGHPISLFMHKINFYKIIWIYKILNFIK